MTAFFDALAGFLAGLVFSGLAILADILLTWQCWLAFFVGVWVAR